MGKFYADAKTIEDLYTKRPYCKRREEAMKEYAKPKKKLSYEWDLGVMKTGDIAKYFAENDIYEKAKAAHVEDYKVPAEPSLNCFHVAECGCQYEAKKFAVFSKSIPWGKLLKGEAEEFTMPETKYEVKWTLTKECPAITKPAAQAWWNNQTSFSGNTSENVLTYETLQKAYDKLSGGPDPAPMQSPEVDPDDIF